MKLDLKSKLLILLVIPLFFIVVLSLTILSNIYNDKKNLEFTKHHILEAEAMSRVAHYMQIERGVTAGLISSVNVDENSEMLLDARKNVDRAIDDAMARVLLCQICTNNGDTLALLEKIKSRRSADLLGGSAVDARAYYTQKIASLHNLIKVIPTLIDDRQNRNYIQSYSYLSSAKEALAQNRAILMEVFTNKEFLNGTFTSCKQNLKIYNLDTQSFIAVAPKKVLYFYNEIFKGEAVEETFKIMDAALNKSNVAFVEPSSWFEKSTQTINLLKIAEDKLFSEVNRLINEKLDAVSYKLMALLLFLVISAVVITFLITLIVRKILFSANALESRYDNSLVLLEQYKSTVDGSFIVSKTDPNGIITYINDEFCRISGYSREDLIGKNHNIIRHPDMPKEFFENMWHTIKVLKKPWRGEVKNLNKNGLAYWLKAIINPILDKDGNVVEYIGMRTDITQQKEMADYFENQLKISTKNFDCSMHLSKEYEKAIDSSTILSRTDKDGNITYANDKFLEITGYTPEEIVGKSYKILSPKDTKEEFYAELWDTISNGNIWHGVIKNITKAGKDFWAKTTVVPIKDLDNKIMQYLAIKFDITEIVEQRREFERVAKTDPLTGCGNRFRLNSDMRELENLSAAVDRKSVV